VLRLRQSNKGRHKLTPPWEGPFVIAEVLRPGTYKLANEEGEVYANTWNIEQLCLSTLSFVKEFCTYYLFDKAIKK
jgi:hypothetical protein